MSASGKTVKVALVGLGTVGQGVAKILLENKAPLAERAGIRLELTRVCDVDIKTPRDVRVPGALLTTELETILNDPEIEIAVELVGGCSVAGDIVRRCLKAGKHVVTANKALLAEHGGELFQLARKQNRCISFEAACAGGIPLVAALRDQLVANRISALYGIVNGTCNYVLTQMTQEGKSYARALGEAQDAGFAEADPTLDVDGTDSAHKLAILAALAFRTGIAYDAIAAEGIDGIDVADLRYGGELGYVMKLLAIGVKEVEGISLRVHPAFISKKDLLARVSGAFNAVSVYGDAVGHSLFYGRGAGRMPTASAVVADLVDVATGNAARRFASLGFLAEKSDEQQFLPVEKTHSRYYIRVSALDKPGTFARIAGILGENRISISAVVQHEIGQEWVPVVITTHLAAQGDVQSALTAVEGLDVVQDRPVCIRIVDEHNEAPSAPEEGHE